MRIRLLYKISAAFLLTVTIVLILTGIFLRQVLHQNFVEFLSKSDAEQLVPFQESLIEEYQQFSWSRLEKYPDLWLAMLSEGLRSTKNAKPQGYFMKDSLFLSQYRQKYMDSLGPHPRKVLRFAERTFLLNQDRHLITGMIIAKEKYRLIPLQSSGETIGYLGIQKRKKLNNPIESQFIEQQYKLFSLVGLGVFSLTVLVAFLLSRHLLAPIKDLTHGTKQIRRGNLAAQIRVRSRDELGDLAVDFNNMALTLDKNEQERKKWISDISHELRTPLAILRGEVEAAQDGIRPLTAETLSSLSAEIGYLEKMVLDLHELTLLDAGTMRFNVSKQNPVSIFEKVLKMYQPRLEKTEMAIEVQIEAISKKLANVDEYRLMQVFSNVLENTLKHATKPGIVYATVIENYSTAIFSIEDTGPGVDLGLLDKLFDRLYRVDLSRKRLGSGSGLGLAISKSIIEAQGGSIVAEKSEKGGLKIKITIPFIS